MFEIRHWSQFGSRPSVAAIAHAQSPVSGVRLSAAVETMNGRTEAAKTTHPE